ncbi:MAG: acetyl-CoA C-acyltransferase, partial [Desulfobulbaceae bacterium]|nr:acetyl-CoA C-acyltransferase [Desulfobulbaceae bacterium]
MNAYIVAGYRTAVGKAKKGGFRFTRPDDLGARVIRHLLAKVPQLDPARVDDVIIGNAMPEAEQGLNMARMIALITLPVSVPAMTINRYCASGVESIAIAVGKVATGQAEVIIAGGAESMSLIPMGGWKVTPNYDVALTHPDWYNSMGLTAEAVANDYKISREDQDEYACSSHIRAINAIETKRFKDEIVPIEIDEVYLDDNMKRQSRKWSVETDEGPRKDTSQEKLAALKPVFAAKGSVTAGNSSQTSDGAAMVLVMSDRMVKELNLEPIARMVSYHVSGVEPRIMGIWPVE